MRSRADVLVRAWGGAAEPIEHDFACHNRHFQVTTATGIRMFAKVLDDGAYWRRAITAADVLEPLLPGTPRLLDHGQIVLDGERRWWLLYAWHDLTAFAATPALMEQVGAMIGRLHHVTIGAETGFERHNLDTEITIRAADLTVLDPAAAKRVMVLHTQFGPAELPGPTGLIHGDLHLNNVCLDSHGMPVLVDLENVAAAQSLLDFGKLVDLGQLDVPAQVEAFAAGYHRETGAMVVPWPEAMRWVRLWTTAGVLVYALSRSDTAFAAHGYRQLAILEAS